MRSVYKVINEQIVVEINEATTGEQRFFVLNGGWYGVLDYNNNLVWADNYPDRKQKLMSIRTAVKGEFAPYY